jgi:hypothetical protein
MLLRCNSRDRGRARHLPPIDSSIRYFVCVKEDRFTGWSFDDTGGHHANHVTRWAGEFCLYIVLPPDLGSEQAGWLTLGATSGMGLTPPHRLVEPKPGRLALPVGVA